MRRGQSQHILDVCSRIRDQLVSLDCPLIQAEEDPKVVSEIVFDRSHQLDLLEWFASKLLDDHVTGTDPGQMCNNLGVPDLEKLDEAQTLNAWQNLIKILESKVESNEDDLTVLTQRGRHYLDYIVQNVFNVQGPAASSKVLSIPRDLQKDLKLSSKMANLPKLDTLVAIKDGLNCEVLNLSSPSNQIESTDESSNYLPQVKASVEECQKSLDAIRQAHKDDFGPWIATNCQKSYDVREDGLGDALDRMSESVAKIYSDAENQNSIRQSTNCVASEMKRMESVLLKHI